MAAVMFDTHAVIKRLQESGFSEQQAETMAGVLQDTQKTSVEHLATKWDIQDLKRDIKELEANTKRDLKGLEANTKRDLKELEASKHQAQSEGIGNQLEAVCEGNGNNITPGYRCETGGVKS